MKFLDDIENAIIKYGVDFVENNLKSNEKPINPVPKAYVYDLFVKFANGDYGIVPDSVIKENKKSLANKKGDIVGIYKNKYRTYAKDYIVLYYDGRNDVNYVLSYDEFLMKYKAEWEKHIQEIPYEEEAGDRELLIQGKQLPKMEGRTVEPRRRSVEKPGRQYTKLQKEAIRQAVAEQPIDPVTKYEIIQQVRKEFPDESIEWRAEEVERRIQEYQQNTKEARITEYGIAPTSDPEELKKWLGPENVKILEDIAKEHNYELADLLEVAYERRLNNHDSAWRAVQYIIKNQNQPYLISDSTFAWLSQKDPSVPHLDRLRIESLNHMAEREDANINKAYKEIDKLYKETNDLAKAYDKVFEEVSMNSIIKKYN